jgi:hypothetical protein
VVGHDKFVPGVEWQGLEHGVNPCGCIADEDQIASRAAQEPSHGLTSLIEQLWELAAQELDRLTLKPIPQPRLMIEDVARAGAERSVVEKPNLRIERPEAPPSALRLRHELLFYFPPRG